MKRYTVYGALLCAMLSIAACAGSHAVQTAPATPEPPVAPPPAPPDDTFGIDHVPVADSLLLGRDPERALAEAAVQYERAVEAVNREEADAAETAIDRIIRLLVAIEDVETPEWASARDSLAARTSRLMRDLREGRTAAAPKKSIPRVMNRQVARQIRWFQKYNRDGFLSAYARSGLYGHMIRRELAVRGMPMELQWLPIVESGYTPRAQSYADAVGLWQFVLETGKRYGLKRTGWTDDRMDPYKATAAALSYLSDLYEMFDGDWLLAIAAYNCGESRVVRAMKRQRTSDFWKLKLPRETKRYVPRFLAAVYIVEHPEQYGIELPERLPERLFEEYFVEKSVAFADAAGVLGVSGKQLKVLNPGVRYGVTPPSGYPLRVPLGFAGTLHAGLNDIPTAHFTPPPETQRYRVRSGDTLSHIARRYRTTIRKLKAMNGLRTSRIYAGRTLRVPGRAYNDRAYTTAVKASPKPSAKTRASASRRASPKRTPSRVAAYIVRRGDTFFDIAKEYGLPVEALRQANPSVRPGRLQIGHTLKVPVYDGSSTGKRARLAAVAVSRPAKHIVKRGESVWSIARRYGLPVAHVLKINGLTRNDVIKPGQSLIIPPRP